MNQPCPPPIGPRLQYATSTNNPSPIKLPPTVRESLLTVRTRYEVIPKISASTTYLNAVSYVQTQPWWIQENPEIKNALSLYATNEFHQLLSQTHEPHKSIILEYFQKYKYKLETLIAVMRVIKNEVLSQSSRLSEAIHDPQKLTTFLDEVEQLSAQITPPIIEINKQLHHTEKIPKPEIAHMIMLALLEENNIPNPSLEVLTPRGKLLKKKITKLSHSIILSKEMCMDGKTYYSMLIKSTVHNAVILANKGESDITKQSEINTRGGSGVLKVTKTSNVEISWAINDESKKTAVKRVVTVSRTATNPNKMFTEEQEESLTNDDFSKIIFNEPGNSADRLIFKQEYLGQNLHSLLDRLYPEQRQEIARQILEKFDIQYTDIKPENILVAIKSSREIIVTYIDCNTKFVTTFQTKKSAKAKQERAKERQSATAQLQILTHEEKKLQNTLKKQEYQENSLLGLCYTLFVLLHPNQNQYNLRNQLSSRSQQITLAQGNQLPESIITDHLGNVPHLLKILNQAYRSEIKGKEELRIALLPIYADIFGEKSAQAIAAMPNLLPKKSTPPLTNIYWQNPNPTLPGTEYYRGFRIYR